MQIIDETYGVENVRLVTEDNNSVISLVEALNLAEEQEMDLVCVSENAQPPVCKIMDYQKALYQMKKNQKTQKAPSLKEIRIGCNCAQHDIDIKVKQASKFLRDGDIVKVSIIYRGRQQAMIESGLKILENIQSTLSEYGTVTKKPKIEGYQYSMTMQGL